MPVEVGHGAAYPSSHGYPLRQSTRGAAHAQSAGTKFTDLDAAAGLRALQKRIHLVPGAVHDFLQAGGISAAVTILCSQPLHAELRDAAVTLLQAVLQRLPAEASAAFLEARGMQAAVYLLGNSACLHRRSRASDGHATARAAAALLEAVLDAAPQSASQAFHNESGLLTIRMCITCGKLGTAHELEVAEAALCVLHALLVRIGVRADTKRVLCHAVIASDLHQPLLALLHVHPTSMGSLKAVECLAALAETISASVRVLAKDGCVAALLSVLSQADAVSKSVRSAAVLLRFIAQHQSLVRAGIATSDGTPVLIRVLSAVETHNPSSSDVISSILRMLVPQSDELGCMEGKRACHWAAYFGAAQVLQELLEHRPNLEAKDRRGNTALHLAAAANHWRCVELLLMGGADALARNFAGLQPHKLASPGSPAWEQLLAHLEWRACLDEPRLCQFLPSELTSLPAMEQEWQGPAKCYLLPLSGKLRLESADAHQQMPPTARSWIKRTLSGGVPGAEEALASDANRSGCLICEFAVPAQTQIDEIDKHTLGLTLRDFEGREGVVKLPCPVEKLLIRVEESSDQTAAHLAAALHLFMRHHHPGQAEHQHSQDEYVKRPHHSEFDSFSNQRAEASLRQPKGSSTLGAAAAGHAAGAPHAHGDPMSSQTPVSSTRAAGAPLQATSEQHGSEADTAVSGDSNCQQPGKPELHDMPAASKAVESRQEQIEHTPSPFARHAAKHTADASCEQPLPQLQPPGAGKRRPRRAPPLPPPPPPPMPDTSRKAHNPLATAAAMQAVSETRQQQQALAKTIVYAPHEASVAVKVQELEKQIGRVRSRGPVLSGSATSKVEDANLPFTRHRSEQLVWRSDPPACTEMQRQRSQSDPTVPGPLQRTRSGSREWEELQGGMQQQGRARVQERPSEQPLSLRDSQALHDLVGSRGPPADTSLQSSDKETSCPDAAAEKVCSHGPTAHARGGSTHLQADTAVKRQPDGVLIPWRQQSGERASHLEQQPTAQMSEDTPGKESAVPGSQAEKGASQPTHRYCSEVFATSPVEQSTAHGPAEHKSLNRRACDSSSMKVVADDPVTGRGRTQTSLQEPSIATHLHQQPALERHCATLADSASSQTLGSLRDAAGAEDADMNLVPPRPRAGSGRRSKPFSYGPRSQVPAKVLSSSGVYGIAADGSAASTRTCHAQPDAGSPAQGSPIPSCKPFAYGPRGAVLGSSAACIMGPALTEGHWPAADPRFSSPQYVTDAARVQAKLGQRQQDWAVDPRFA